MASPESPQAVMAQLFANPMLGAAIDLDRLEDVRQRTEGAVADASEEALGHLATEVLHALEPILSSVFQGAEKFSANMDSALEIQQFVNLNDDMWRLVLGALDLHKTNVEKVSSILRGLPERVPQSEAIKRAWPPEWAERYDNFVEAVDDISECIALGLNHEFREDLARREAEIPEILRR